jgi:hypothetical protein
LIPPRVWHEHEPTERPASAVTSPGLATDRPAGRLTRPFLSCPTTRRDARPRTAGRGELWRVLRRTWPATAHR